MEKKGKIERDDQKRIIVDCEEEIDTNNLDAYTEREIEKYWQRHSLDEESTSSTEAVPFVASNAEPVHEEVKEEPIKAREETPVKEETPAIEEEVNETSNVEPIVENEIKEEQISEENEKTSAKGPLIFENTEYGTLQEGYNEAQDIEVNVVSRRSVKKKYVKGGVLDSEQKNNWKAWLYLSPVLILMSVFLIYPLINTMAISFMADYKYATGEFSGFTFDNFLIILGLKEIGVGSGVYETNFVNFAIPNTFILVFVTVPLSIAIALIISVLLNNLKWLQKVYQVVFFLPYVTNAIAVGMVFSVLFDKTGVINFIFNTDITWIYGADRWTAMVPLVLYIVWTSLPFKILILLSGLQNVDKQYYQAAKIDAAPKWKVLLRITVPSLSPQILYLMVTSFIGAFKEYTAIVGLFNGPGTSGKGSYDMYTIVYYIYENLSNHTSYAAAAAVFLFLIILCFTFLQLGISKRRVQY